MRFNILCDADWDSRVDSILDVFSDSGYRNYFQEKNYGEPLDGITIVFMCRDSAANFKQRIRHSKKERKLYMDLMLDLHLFRKITDDERTRIIAEKLISEVPAIVAKYNFKDFDLDKLRIDINKIFSPFLK